MTPNSPNMLKTLNAYLVYIGPVLIFLGMIRLMVFYYTFNISIFNFLDFSEILVSFFDGIFVLFLLSLVIFLSFSAKEVIGDNTFWQHHRKLILRIYRYLTMILTIGTFVISFFFWRLDDRYYMSIYLTIACLLAMGIFTFNIGFRDELKYGIISVLLSVSIISALSGYKAYRLTNIHSSFGVSIKIDEQVFVSDSLTYYIGKTQNYLFIYKSKEQETIVYPMSRVKEIDFPKR